MRKLTTTCITLLGAGLFYNPLYELAVLSTQVTLLSHTLFIPIVCCYLLWTQRKRIFSKLDYSPLMGIGLMFVSLLIMVYHKNQLGDINTNDGLSISISSMVLWIWGGYLWVCGSKTFAKSLFPMMFLVFMIPIPSWVLDPVVRFLQLGSTYAAQNILRLFDVPAYFEGVYITLPGVTVEVAEECSGIRSALALLILSAVAGYLFLDSNWRRICLIFFVVPVTLIKNGMRVSMLALLGSYVDMSYLTDSALHSYGGKPFLVVAILMMLPVLWGLRRSEKTKRGNTVDKQPPTTILRKFDIPNDAQSL